MRHVVREFVAHTVVGGMFVVLPAYLATLLLLKAMRTVAGIVKPVAALLPEGIPAEGLLSLLLVLGVCFVVGVAVNTGAGRAVGSRLEHGLFERLPGYGLIRSLTQRLGGGGDQVTWKPALVQFDDALVPAFIIEEHADGQYTVFVPSVPTPLAGAVYIMARSRVYPVDIPFRQAIRSISRWGSGSREMVAAMERRPLQSQRA